VNSTTDVMTTPAAASDGAERTASWPDVGRQLFLVAQLSLAALVVYLYAIEGPAFLRLFLLATAGFAINLVLPIAYRLPFFVALSVAGAALFLGVADAAWLIASGLVLIGLCHLPFSMKVRVALLLVAATALAVSRAGVVAAPWSGAVWPILGSMFMFRLVLYMLAMKTQKDRSFTAALAYFFMFPNLAFPLYPVVDYQTFRRTYYDRPDLSIYEQGLVWISRGLVHLLLYRFVYYGVLNDPVDVVRLSDLVQFMLGTFLLYLRVSGQFHLIVGLLHMFGFRLPETHKLYYLAHSFTELWRRINIYWTGFMEKAVFYPTYFKVKKLGPTNAIVVSTVAVFVTTWVLHSYQWFWLRGGFPLTLQDTLFWGILGGLVVWGAVKDLNAPKKARQRVTGWSFRLGLQSATTFAFFCFLWSLWSTESVSQWLWMLGAAGNVDVRGVLLLGGTFLTLVALGGRDWEAAPKGERPQWLQLLIAPATRTVAALLLLVAAAQPALLAVSPAPVAEGFKAMRMTGLNARDAAIQHRGYYEQLEVRAQPNNAQVLDVVGRGDQWDDLASIGVLRERKDVLLRDLYPSRTAMWNGRSFSTNYWGMRDREYTKEKPADTLRIALLGPSHVMGNGVADGATFEALVEERLNREFANGKYKQIEILNFGVDGYALPQQVAILEDRVIGFKPDVVIATHYQRNRLMTERYLQKVVDEDVTVPYPEVEAMLQRAGLADIDRGNFVVPFAAARRVVKWFGVEPRMPTGEAQARVRWIADDLLTWSIERFAAVTRANGAAPVVLALNAVIDDVPDEVPNRRTIEASGIPVIDLFDVFPASDRPALRVAPWDDHPNARGHQRIADHLYPELVAFLENKDRR
jgi:D-alanyl-lipoteichoic acid acyltransferase DltB (MBOAT superfamily)